MEKNQIQVQNQNSSIAISKLSKPQQLMVDIANNYCEVFDDINRNEAKKIALQFANKLVNVKTKSGQPAFQVCTADSIKETFFEVLNNKIDLTKSQGALIAYGDKLQLQLEYFGNVKLAKEKIPGLVDIRGVVIYKGDEIQVSVNNGIYKIEKHTTNFANMRDENIVGAYSIAIYRDKDGKEIHGETELMNAQELKHAWGQSKNGTSVHSKFGHEMARKTVESRNAKHLLNKLSTFNYFFSDDEEETENEVETINVIDVNTVEEPKNSVEQTTIVEEVEPQVVETPQEPIVESNYTNTFDFPSFGEPNPQPTSQENTNYLNSFEAINNYYARQNEEFNKQYSEPQPQTVETEEEKLVVSYGDWINNYKPSGQWKLAKYDSSTKTASIVRIS